MHQPCPLPNFRDLVMEKLMYNLPQFTAPEQLVAFNKANLETAVSLASVALEGAERFANLQLAVAKEVLAESAKTAKELLAAKDGQDLLALQPAYETVVEKALGYSRNVYDVASETQGEASKILEARFAELRDTLVAVLEKAAKSAPGSDAAVAAIKSAVAAANSAYDNLQKATKQVAELTEANVAAIATAPKTGSKKKAA